MSEKLAPDAPFDLTKEHTDTINAMLPACEYVVGIRENATGEVRFCPQSTEWSEASIYWWSTGNMGCDCNREPEFRRQTEPDFDGNVQCGEVQYTVVGIWLPDGSDIRDLNELNDF